MKLKTTGAVMVGILLLVSCRSVKKFSSDQTSTEAERMDELYSQFSRNLEIEEFGDTLKGRVPFPIDITKPTVITGESQGISLELTISDQGIGYKAIAKPVARSKLSYSDTIGQISSIKEQSSSSTVREKEVKKRLPLWLYPVVVIVMFVASGLIVNKTPLKWVKYLKNLKRR
ncbi:hypothetical protein MM236_19160 [Belliella sp. DSM 107340]|uniref:Lipoprotein n=1 Tax=Belliella calami TaxID=2923436 RepID=A0ABS9UUF6_9BACT|nr:hypothetical protein [Belliella calami]MCH7400123.1 hypothetical protein [Belliella calami]